MKTLLKVIAALIGIIVLVIVVAAIAIPIFFDPNDYKQQIAMAVTDRTGRDFQIEGDIGLSVFPWLGMDLGTVELGNAPGFSGEVFARAERIAIRVKLLPLLSKKVEMDTLTIHGLDLNLARNEQGQNNWENLLKGKPEAKSKPEEEGKPTEEGEVREEGGPPPIAGLSLGGLDLRDATLRWADAMTGNRYMVDALTLETTELTPKTPVEVKAKFKLESLEPKIAADVAASTTLGIDLAAEIYKANDVKVDAQLTETPMPGGKATVSLVGNALFDKAHQALTLMDLGLDVANLDLEGSTGEIALRAELTGNLANETYDVSGLSLKGNLAGDSIPGGKLVMDLGAKVNANLAKQTLTVSDLSVDAADLKATGTIAATEILKQPRFDGALSVAQFSPRELLKRLGQPEPDTADATVLASAELATTLSGTLDQVNLKPLSLKLDDTTLEGTLAVGNFQAPAITFDLAVDQFDADRYLPPPTEGKTPPPATPGAAVSAAGTLPLDTLRALDMDGRLAVGRLKVANLRVSDMRLTLKAKDGRIKLNPLGAKLYQGTYAGNIGLDARGEQARVTLDEKIVGIQASPLLKDLQGKDRLSGTANLSMQLSATGTDPEAFKKTLNGQTSFSFTDGSVKGINIGRMIRKAKATLEGRSLPPEEETVKTDFSELRGTVHFRDGVATNQDLTAKSPLLRVQGEGSANLVTEHLDYRLTATLVDTTKGQGGKELKDLEGIPIPITVTGSLAQPKYGLDLKSIVKARADKEIERQKDKVQEKLEKKLEEKLGDPAKDLLKGLFR